MIAEEEKEILDTNKITKSVGPLLNLVNYSDIGKAGNDDNT